MPWIFELSGKNLTAAEPQKEETAEGSQLCEAAGLHLYKSHDLLKSYDHKKAALKSTNTFLSIEITQTYLIKQ